MTLVATIDAGGSGVKLGIVSLETWQTVAIVRREYVALAREPGLYEWDPSAWWSVIENALAEAVVAAGEHPKRYTGVICTGMRIPFVLVDDRCEPLAPGVLVPDVRGRMHRQDACEAVGADALYATTGHWSAPHFGLPKLLWYVRERRELWKRTRWVLQFSDWLLERLCGVVASEHSSASMSQLLDVSTREWAATVLDATGIDAGRLPPLCQAGSLAGGLRSDVARRVGLLPGTPVHVGGGDTHVASHGVRALARDSVTVVAGTTTPIMLATTRPLLDPLVRPLVSVHVLPGRWAAETNVGTSGAMLGWLRDLSACDYPALHALASASPLGARGVFVCAANPEWGPAGWADVPPISLVGVSPAHGVGDLARAVLESSAHAVACNLARLESLLDEPRADIALAGGGGRSPFAAQVLADVLGRRVVVPQLENAAAVGGAMLVAGLERAPVDTPSAIYEPDAELHGAYTQLTRRYAEVFAALRGTASGSAA